MIVTHVMSIRSRATPSALVHGMPSQHFTFCGAHPQPRHRVQPAGGDAPTPTCPKCLRAITYNQPDGDDHE